jgi:excinuclease UvrABC ATPase subunit
MHPAILIKGARTTNLKNISLNIPHNKLIVVTGISGSEKSSLVFDVLPMLISQMSSAIEVLRPLNQTF